MIQRLGLIGDIHAEADALEECLGLLSARGVDRIAAAGDIVDGRGSVDRCVELLRAFGVLAVRGNHERWFLAGVARDLPEATPRDVVSPGSLAWLASLPATLELQTCAGVALLCHGLGSNDMAKVAPDDSAYALEVNGPLQELLRERRYRFVLNGHSHRRLVRDFGVWTLINAGTLKRDHDPGFSVVDFSERTVRWFPLGSGFL